MAAQANPVQEEICLSSEKTRRDPHVSIVLIVVGIAVSVGFYSYQFWVNSSGTYAPSAANIALLAVIGGIGSTLLLLGAILAGINWSLLRKTARTVSLKDF